MRLTSLRRCNNILAGTLKRRNHLRWRKNLLLSTQKNWPISVTNLNLLDHVETSSWRLNWCVNKTDLLSRLCDFPLVRKQNRSIWDVLAMYQLVPKWDWPTKRWKHPRRFSFVNSSEKLTFARWFSLNFSNKSLAEFS